MLKLCFKSVQKLSKVFKSIQKYQKYSKILKRIQKYSRIVFKRFARDRNSKTVMLYRRTNSSEANPILIFDLSTVQVTVLLT